MQRVSVKTVVALAALWASVACSGNPPVATTSFQGPAGLVLAGPQFQRLFVANTGIDTLQVVDMSGGLSNLNMIPGPARYFPLNVPAGPDPTELAATFDGNYVMVLNAVTSSVRVLNATSLYLVSDANGPVTLQLGGGDAQPSSMVGSPSACVPSVATTDTCLGRAYVALSSLGLIAAVDVRQAQNGNVSLALDNLIPVGGAPWRLAANPVQPYLYATDAANADLIRVNLQTNVVDRTALGSGGGPVAVSADGNYVIVGRPEMLDVVILGAQGSGSLPQLDANPLLIPLPGCVQACQDDNVNLCPGAHLSDLSLCADGAGVASGPMPAYGAVYVGGIPGQLGALGLENAQEPLQEQCVGPNGVEVVANYNESVAVATLDGTISFIGLTDENGNPNFHLVQTGACGGPSLLTSPGSPFPSNYLDACPNQPPGRNAFACVGDMNDVTGSPNQVVSVLRGYDNQQKWAFFWEAVYPGLDRSSGGGAIDANGNFYDNSGVFANGPTLQVRTNNFFGGVQQYGDILELVNPPAGACAEALGIATLPIPPCAFERRIVSVGDDGAGHTVLGLDAPYPNACANQQDIGYRIRAGDAFIINATMNSNNTQMVFGQRVGIGDPFGMGFGNVSGQTQGTSFRINPALALQAASAVPACQRYIAGNANADLGMAPFLTRNQSLAFAINDPFAPAQTGANITSAGVIQGNVGNLPTGIVVTPKGANRSMLVVSYAGSDALVVSIPFNTSNLLSVNSTYKVLQ